MGSKRILVIGGGISGLTTALEAAEVGSEVTLVEREPYLGGRVARMYQYFPKLCPPSCGLEINFKRVRSNSRIQVLTSAEVTNVSGGPGNYEARIKVRPRYVTGQHPLSQAHLDAVKTEVPDEFNYGMKKRKALALPHEMAFPYRYNLDRSALTAEEVTALTAAAPAGALDLGQKETELTVDAAAIVIAAGWKPFDAKKFEALGFGRFPNVINNVMMERLAAPNGPTGGQILRPSDSAPPRTVAFVQCVGSRDENYLPYCSGVCCMGSLKQARYVRAKLPETSVTIFYIDIRPISRLEKFYYDLLSDEKVKFVKGKVPKIGQDGSRSPVLSVEEMLNQQKLEAAFDLCVLATGVVPSTAEDKIPGLKLELDPNGFVVDSPEFGIFGAGCVKRPLDVSRSVKDATAAALKAIQIARR